MRSRRLVLLVAAALLAGCARPYVQDQGPVVVTPWRSRTRLSSERAAAVLVRVAPDLEGRAAESPGLDWGLMFYEDGTGRLAVVAPLADTARGIEDESDGLYVVPMPPGDYVAASLYVTIGGQLHIRAIPGPSFERFSLERGEIRTLGSVDAVLTPTPGQETALLTSWTQAHLAVQSSLQPGMPAAFAGAVLSKILSRPDTLSGWDASLRRLAAQLPAPDTELARASRR